MGKNTFTDLLVIFSESRFLGVFPFDKGWVFSSKYFLLSSVAALGLLSYSLYAVSTSIRGDFSSISFFLRRTLIGLLPTIHLYQLYACRSRISRAFQVIKQCEVVLERLGLNFNYNWSFLLCTFILRVVFSASHNVFWAGVTSGFSLAGLLEALHVGGMLFLAQLIEMQFYTVLFILRTLFTALPTIIYPSSKKRRLEAVVKCHHLLSGVGDDVESIYSLQVLVFMSYIYIALLNFSLDSIKGFLRLLKSFKSKTDLGEHSLSLALTVSWVFYCFIHFQFVANECVNLSNEVKKTNKTLYKAMLQSPNKCLLTSNKNQNADDEVDCRGSKQGKLRLQLEMNRQLNFTACGMFPVDYTMVHSVAASAAVFLVIISQFDT